MDIARLRFWVCLLLMPAVVGCAGVPVEQLQAYSGAYEEAREAGSLLYERAAVAVWTAEATGVAPGAPPPDDPPYQATLGPANYGTGACGFGAAGVIPESVLARCQAFAAVTRYNEILLKLASGDPAVAVRSELAQLNHGLGTLRGFLTDNAVLAEILRGVAPVLGPLASIVDQAQQLASAAAVRQELDKGRPHIQAIVTALQEDVPRLYDIQRDYYVVQLTTLVNTTNIEVYRPAGRLLIGHAPPSTPGLVSERAAVTAHFDDLLAELEDFPAKPLGGLAGEATAQPYTSATTEALRSHVAELETRVGHYRGLAADWRAYEQALRRYDAMLAEVGGALATLGTNDVGNFFAANGAIAQWLSSAVTVRDAALDIEALLTANRSPENAL
jgi:hypothetical protein